MGDKTGIEWTDSTWNPIAGCSIISPGCTNCYAMQQAARIQRMTPDSHYVGTTRVVHGNPVWTGKIATAPNHILFAPLAWQKPRRIFVNSMSDLFHENVSDEQIAVIFGIMALAHRHTFIILTKRSARMRKWFEQDFGLSPAALVISDMYVTHPAIAGRWPLTAERALGVGQRGWPLPNVWLGVSAEDQKRWDERVPDLAATPAAIRLVSVEPMLGPIKTGFTRAPKPDDYSGWTGDGPIDHVITTRGQSIHWVICGGEGGPNSRPMHFLWERQLREQCATAGVAYFRKQWGEWAPVSAMSDAAMDECYEPLPEGVDPERRRRCKVPCTVMHYDGSMHDVTAPRAFEAGNHAMTMFKIGKKKAGHLIDGVGEHRAWPVART